MSDISIQDFLEIKNQEIQIIDVREYYEYAKGHLKALHIPMDQVLQSINKIHAKNKVIIYCQTGRRAAAVVYMLKKYHNMDNVYNLLGGYTAYTEAQLKVT